MRAWLVTFHLVGMVMWTGGVMAFVRLLTHHAVEPPSARPILSKIEKRLNYLIAFPGAILTIACGVLLVQAFGRDWFRVSLWLHVKLALVGLFFLLHYGATRAQHRIARLDPNAPLRSGGWTSLNVLFALLLVAIIALGAHQPMVGGS